MKVADLVVFLMYLMLFIRPIMQLTMLTEQYQRSMAGFRRYAALMDQKADVVDRPGASKPRRLKDALNFATFPLPIPGVIRRFYRTST